jgi:muramidase (phage lysozyme)
LFDAVVGSANAEEYSHSAASSLQPQFSKTVTPQQFERFQANVAALANPNVKAYLSAIGSAEGGGYDFKYGAVAGKANDSWRFIDYSTHPGAGSDGKTTAAGMYQIKKATWQQNGGKSMGLIDFSPMTQDLIAVDLLRAGGVLDKIQNGDMAGSMPTTSKTWAALPMGPGSVNYWKGQPYVNYEKFLQNYVNSGGSTK